MKIHVFFFALIIFIGGLAAGFLSNKLWDKHDKTEIEQPELSTQAIPKERIVNNPTQLPQSLPIQDRISEFEMLLQDEINRRADLEMQLAKLELQVELIDSFNQSLTERPTENPTNPAIRNPPPQSGLNTENLIKSGVDTDTANELVATWNRYQLEQLELRDTASREGWLGSEEYREKVRALGESQISLREEIGDQKYDQYLYESGQPNRVAVSSVIAGSSAESVGLRSGDIINEYAGKRTFTSRELQTATRDGTRDETVSIQVLRDGERIELNVPRGPLGIMLDVERVEPL